MRSVVRGVPDATLGAGDEQTFLVWVFAHHAREFGRRDPRIDARPVGAAVGRLPEIWTIVVELKTIRRDVRGAFTELRRVDARDAAELLHVFRCDVFPSRSAVARDVDHTVVGASPHRVRSD